MFVALGGKKIDADFLKAELEKTREQLKFVNIKKAFLGIEDPPKVDRGIVRLKCHGKNLIFRQSANGVSYTN